MISQVKGSAVLAGLSLSAGAALLVWKIFKEERRYERSKFIQEEIREEEAAEGSDTLPSIISHFQGTKISIKSDITEANGRRTLAYYQKARDAHLYSLVLGVRSYPRLRNRREKTMKRIMHYYTEGTKSHRTIIIMCDNETSSMLNMARTNILDPLNLSHDITTEKAWIPAKNIIPNEDLHVTVATPWWWHTMREGNQELSEELVTRFRQTLVSECHHAFQIELERFVLLGGQSLVALWRCIGQRKTEDGFIIYDRHGSEIDPFVKLRKDIVRCFTTDQFGAPLTYNERIGLRESMTNEATPVTPSRGNLVRANSIELKTPGLGSGDGFIHTTLARLPLDCLSMQDVDLDPIHRLCREATATYCGHRMVVKEFRFLETTGAGGESNPCIAPITDATIEAPVRVQMTETGIVENHDLHTAKKVDTNATIGAVGGFHGKTLSMDGLFDGVDVKAVRV
ncbi:unnamed protein product [Cylindrotheca closterium]|uniref:Uncharacterized protein n=1 Tax=Cylindrotheca closterium TaxID=2856 RepID=A0AAD2CEE6_9STRA|nr:unnamed protein product [Cylindrotheca closterium]